MENASRDQNLCGRSGSFEKTRENDERVERVVYMYILTLRSSYLVMRHPGFTLPSPVPQASRDPASHLRDGLSAFNFYTCRPGTSLFLLPSLVGHPMNLLLTTTISQAVASRGVPSL
jgi:hypothetical protein